MSLALYSPRVRSSELLGGYPRVRPAEWPDAPTNRQLRAMATHHVAWPPTYIEASALASIELSARTATGSGIGNTMLRMVFQMLNATSRTPADIAARKRT